MQVERLLIAQGDIRQGRNHVVDIGKGMDSTTENSITKWCVLRPFCFYTSYVCYSIV